MKKHVLLGTNQVPKQVMNELIELWKKNLCLEDLIEDAWKMAHAHFSAETDAHLFQMKEKLNGNNNGQNLVKN